MTTTNEIREQFLRYFEENEHRRVHSSSLLPAGDPTLLFTNAGMNQFKDLFLGRDKRDYARATTSQKCVRAGGKHNDLENVGRTARHHTFFEMLGNFSFGDYFKEDAIRFAWELIVDVYGLDVSRLWFTVFEGDGDVAADDEAAELWIKAGAPPDRVLRFGRSDNFWQMGDTGPCGPCSEIHYFRGDDLSKNTPDLVNSDCDDTMEIWNLVFMQYDRSADGILTPLPAPSVDTGMGLERLAAVMQDVYSNYDTDSFVPLIRKIEELGRHTYGRSFDSDLDTAVRVLCDHARSASFLIADGVIPSNEGRGYVLRRIIRRGIRFGRKLDSEVRLSTLVPSVVESLGGAYPELVDRTRVISETLESEEERFAKTLSVGMERVGDALDKARQLGRRTLSGEEVFRLYDTYGIPIDLINELGEDEGVTIDVDGYETAMSEQRERAKASSKFKALDVQVFEKVAERVGAVEFVGYDSWADVECDVIAIVRDDEEVDSLGQSDECEVVITPTPFYAESGGQIGDGGYLEWSGGKAIVLDTQKPVGDLIVSSIRVVEGSLERGRKVKASVPLPARLATTYNHTGTHLLHKALKDVLGDTVSQAGSLVAPDRLRFDFTWGKPLTDEEIVQIEDLVNEKIRENIEVTKQVVPIAEAKSLGAVAMFGEKYGDMVRVVSAGEFSRELCGGCHVNRTGDIGVFKILSDKALAAGVRRMEALTGPGAVEYLRHLEAMAREIQSRLNVPIEELPGAVRSLQDRQKNLEKELKSLKMKLAASGGSSGPKGEDEIVEVEGIRLLARQADGLLGGELRHLADTFRDRLKSGVVVIGSAHEGKATLLAAVTEDVIARGVSAHLVIQELAPIVGGRGGGKADMAQAGGKDPDKIGEALARAPEVLRGILAVVGAAE